MAARHGKIVGMEHELAGGNVAAGVVRVGGTVRKPAGYWTPAVEALLAHLEAGGFTGARWNVARPRLSGGFLGGSREKPDTQVHADAPRREIARRKWLTRRIRYPRVAHFLRISRILRVNQPGWAAGGAGGSDGTG